MDGGHKLAKSGWITNAGTPFNGKLPLAADMIL